MASKNNLPYVTGKVTRNPRHDKAQDIYAPNFRSLKIFLDDVEIDNRQVMTAYVDEGRLSLFVRDEKGYVAVASPGNPKYYEVKGVVRVEGQVSGCTNCALTRRRNEISWWKRINSKADSW